MRRRCSQTRSMPVAVAVSTLPTLLSSMRVMMIMMIMMVMVRMPTGCLGLALLTSDPVDPDECAQLRPMSLCRLPGHYQPVVDASYYSQFVSVDGVPVMGSRNVSGAALLEAARLLRRMVAARPDLTRDMTSRRDRVVVLGKNERLVQLPEYRGRVVRDLRGYSGQGVVVCAEENLLCDPDDQYRGYSACMHELAHALDAAFTRVDPALKRFVVTAYRQALDDGKWRQTYAGTDPAEYFAEVSVSWFDAGVRYPVPGLFNGLWSRDQLKQYDPFVAGLLGLLYGDQRWRYDCADVCHQTSSWSPLDDC